MKKEPTIENVQTTSIDRRITPHYSCHKPAKISFTVNDTQQVIDTVILDISQSGARISSGTQLPAQIPIHLVLPQIDSSLPEISLSAQVQSENRNINTFIYSLIFKPSAEIAEKLSAYFQYLSPATERRKKERRETSLPVKIDNRTHDRRVSKAFPSQDHQLIKTAEEWHRYSLADFYSIRGADDRDIFSSFYDYVEEGRKFGFSNLYEQELLGPPTNVVKIYDSFHKKDREVLNFSSYNYLGLANHPAVLEAAEKALKHYGLGASGSPILSGTFDIHNELCRNLANFKKKDSVLLYPTGYSGNVGAISALLRPGDVAFIDKFIHASIVDGIILSRAKARYFDNNNIEQLESYLKKETTARRKLVVVEGVYSMDGNISQLPDIVALAKKYNCLMMIDEAHSTLVFGKQGRGVAEYFNVEKDIDITFGTLSKAFGGVGSFVAGNKDTIEYIRYYSRSRFFSCFLPPVIVAGVNKALEVYLNNPSLKKKLWENIKYITDKLLKNKIDIGNTQSQIIPVMIKNDKVAYELARDIFDDGLFVQPIVYPAVKRNQSRFRLSITSQHTQQDMDKAINIIARYFTKYGIINP